MIRSMGEGDNSDQNKKGDDHDYKHKKKQCWWLTTIIKA
jgi:hypothetical protein